MHGLARSRELYADWVAYCVVRCANQCSHSLACLVVLVAHDILKERFFLQVMQFEALSLILTHTSKPGCGCSGEEGSPHGKACMKRELIDY